MGCEQAGVRMTPLVRYNLDVPGVVRERFGALDRVVSCGTVTSPGSGKDEAALECRLHGRSSS